MTSRGGKRRKAGRWAIGAALCLMLAPAARADSPATRTASHCRAGETILYACRFGKKLGSVCAAPGALHYRFGPAGRLEIDIANAPDWSNIRLSRVVGQGGGHQTHVRFTRGETHYIVYEGGDGSLTRRPGHRYSGIDVLQGARGDQPLASLKCRGGAMIDPDFAEGIARYAPSIDPERLAEETGGPFDGWY